MLSGCVSITILCIVCLEEVGRGLDNVSNNRWKMLDLLETKNSTQVSKGVHWIQYKRIDSNGKVLFDS